MSPYSWLLACMLAITPPHAASAHAGIDALLHEPPSYSGQPIDLDLVDAPLNDALRMLAEIGNFSCVLDPGVTGKVTLHLKGVPWDQALSLILKSHGLGFDVENGTLLVGGP